VAAVVECGTHAVLAAEVGPLAEHETVLARRLFDRLPAGMLVPADRVSSGSTCGGPPSPAAPTSRGR
jgi:hypothetical protein